ncbi:MAG: hypothetical protein RLZZ50_1453 [Verrucomicrobiota bacterium]
MRYAHTIHEDAIQSLFALPLSERRKLLNECEVLARSPFAEPDYVRAEADGRPMSHVIRGNHAIAYWVDHSAKLIFITRIDLAD